jgi:hypothetical protein
VVLGDWLSHILADRRTSEHGLNEPVVSRWDVLWQCVVCTAIVRGTDGGGAVCAIETHVVVAGGSEAVSEVVGAVLSSTEGKGELVAGGECHCKACVCVCVCVCEVSRW